MRTLKKSLMVLLVCCLAVFVLPMLSAEVQAEVYGEWEYTVDSGVATVTKYNGTAAVVEVPAFFDDVYQVRSIGQEAFSGNKTVTKVVLPNAVTYIGESAFENCVRLVSADLPEALVDIDRFAFSGCVSLESITLPENLKTVNEKAFMNCIQLRNITVKSEEISDLVYKTGYLGASEHLNNYCQPFFGCGTGADGITVTFTKSCKTIPANLFYAFEGEAGAPKITKVIIENGTTNIHNYAFRGCKQLTSVTLPNSLEKIGNGAFEDCVRLKKITLPKSLKYVGRYAFAGCVQFESITLPEDLEVLSEKAFMNCVRLSEIVVDAEALEDLILKTGYVGAASNQNDYCQPFYGCGTATDGITVTFTENCAYVPARLFYAYEGNASVPNITKVVIRSGATAVHEYAFRALSNLKSVTLPASVKTIEKGAFEACTALKKISLPASLTKIGSYAFYQSGLTAITLPKKLETIGDLAFKDCVDLEKITVKSAALQDIKVSLGVNPKIYGQPFYGAGVAGSGIEVVFEEGVKSIPALLFHAYEGKISAAKIKSVEIASTVEKIGTNAFTGLIDLKKVRFFGNAPAMGKNAFYGVTATVYYPNCKTWTAEDKAAYGGTLTWKGYGPKYTAQPKTAVVKNGAKAAVQVTATGKNLTYTWYVKSKGADKYVKSSVTQPTYSVTMNSKTKDRAVYCVITDKDGWQAKSKTVYLRMAARVTTQPKTTYTKSGSTAKVSVKAAGDGLTYTWYVKNKGETKFTKSSVTKSAYSVKMTSKTKDRQVYCVVKDKYGKSAKTKTVTLRMAASITTQPKTVTVAKNKTAKVTVKAAGDGLTYTWYVKNKGASRYTKSSTKTATYSVKMTSKTNGRQVYCVVKDKYGKSVKTKTVTLKMK